MRQGSMRKAEDKPTPAGTVRKPPPGKVQTKARVAKAAPKREGSRLGKPEKSLAELSAEHAAISEILRVMSASPGDVRPVLDAVAERAARLCEAPFARVSLVDGDVLRAGAEYSIDGTPQARTVPLPMKRSSIVGRAVLDRRVVHHADVVPLLKTEYPDAVNARRLGLRAVLAVPLIREGEAYGAIFLFRREPHAFSPNQVALAETFAQQAAIAIENVRLFNVTKEALERQMATSEILRVISQSRTDARPVFETIVEAARRLCAATSANVVTFDGEMVHVAALASAPADGGDALRRHFGSYPRSPSRDTANTRAILTRAVVMIPDVLQDAEYRAGATAVAAGYRSVLAVPLMRDGDPIGAITVARPEPGPFPEIQVTLLQTFADQAEIAIENVRLFTELTHNNRALTQAHAQVSEALERQTATSEVLRVISSSPTDVQPVFETIVASAARLCSAESAAVYRFDDEMVDFVAGYHFSRKALEAYHRRFPCPLRETDHLQRVLDGSVLNISDIEKDPHTTSGSGDVHRARGVRSTVIVPMVREDRVIGAIGVSHRDVGAFTNERIGLLKTFADQAVIAIENVRLFHELQVKNRDLTEALEHQTATSEILRVISQSPTDLQPVLDTVAANAARLCESVDAQIFRIDGQVLRPTASFGSLPRTAMEETRPIGPGSVNGRAVVERRTIHIHDLAAESETEWPEAMAFQRRFGHRSIVATPLLREGTPIGAITIRRMEVRPFSDNQIKLLETFADQAVIAIENVRLFTELEARNRELTESLEQQTATSEILRVISRSPMNVQPVFDTIVTATLRLCSARSANLFTFDGELLHLAAHARPTGAADETVTADSLAMQKNFPRPPGRDLAASRAVLTCSVVSIPDVLTDAEYAFKEAALAGGFRSVLAVPLIREGSPIGAIVVGRPEPEPFPETQVALLKTFADQAVIAIENVRLFKELEARTRELTRSVDELKALGEVGQAVSSTLDLETVLTTIVSRATQLAGMDGGSIWEYDEAAEEFHLHATDRLPSALVEALRATPIRKGEGALGRMAITGEPVEIRDFADERSYQSQLRASLIRFGYRSVLAVPLLREDHLLGALAVNRGTPGEFASEVVDLLKTFATQSALAIQNARLFREIELKSRQLEVASQHKSEFLANMSHELRTPLNAIIGFSEVLSERMFGEINEKQAEYIGDILQSGQHLLSLINDILDLSKIEAGRMELELSDFDLPGAIENTLILVRERAQRRGIMLARTVDERVGMIRADERKVKQVLLNLLSNAVKFTPEGGRIDVRGAARDGTAEISVTDTGVGIAPEEQDAVFEEFRQVGTADKKVEGTGLGLAISRKFIELHGGKIWVTSKVGSGSTFTFTLPLR